MPVTLSALKKLRQDRKRTAINYRIRNRYKAMLKKMRKNPKKNLLAAASSSLDRAVKRHVIHPNKAARLKSKLAHLVH